MDRTNQAIMSFSGDYRWLSNFWAAPIPRDGVVYRSVEHAYMAAKCDAQHWKHFCAVTPRPGDVKRASRTITLRTDWETIKQDVMLDCLRKKFADQDLSDRLLRTGDALIVEGNTWGDVFWGVDVRKTPPTGLNVLGQMLMHIRAEHGGCH